MTSFDPLLLRKDFPFFAQENTVWLDNAATTQKPQGVLDRVLASMSRACTVHRAFYALAEETTLAYEEARAVLAGFIGASSKDEIVFTGGTTAAVNFLARSFYLARKRTGRKALRIVTSVLEHHSNFLPWCMLGDESEIELVVIGHDAQAGVDMEALAAALDRPCDIVALTLCSNVSGAWLDSRRASSLAHDAGAVLFLDAAQAAAHRPLCVGAADGAVSAMPQDTPDGVLHIAADAVAFSGHKMYGPEGSGVLWARQALLDELVPVSYGGEMVLSVKDQDIQWNRPPRCFEAGTPNVSAVLGLASAAEWLQKCPRDALRAHEESLGKLLHDELRAFPGVHIFSRPGPILSFTLDGWHAHDLADFLDQEGLALRAGRLCAEPFVRALGVPALVRASLAAYTSQEDCMRLLAALEKAHDLRRGSHA
jgi:cysteine desulfurase/selenocysteine lyase